MNKCQRCGTSTNVTTMSFFNTEMICMKCDKEERNHPDFQKAKDAELEQVRKGNYNFEGIGKPKDLTNTYEGSKSRINCFFI